MYVLNILFYTKRQEYARTHSSNTTRYSSSGKELSYRVATHRGGVRYIGSGKIVLVGIIRQQAAKRMSKYRLQNTHRIHHYTLTDDDAQRYFVVIKIRSKRWRVARYNCKTYRSTHRGYPIVHTSSTMHALFAGRRPVDDVIMGVLDDCFNFLCGERGGCA